MTLPKEDLNLIAQIDARLKHYNLIQPIDTTEGEYVRCVGENPNYTIGKIYPVIEWIDTRPTLKDDKGTEWSVYGEDFKPATHAEFLAQEQGKEPNPNVIKFYDKYFKKAKTIAPIETEQRYEVVTALMPSCDDDYMIVVSSSISTKLRKLKAEELAEAIKQYLSTNKF